MTFVIIAICITLTAFFILIAYLLRESKKTGKFENETKYNELFKKRMEEIRKIDKKCGSILDNTIDNKLRNAAKTNK